jgi:POT family proton-dependent oligopeptide transporter
MVAGLLVYLSGQRYLPPEPPRNAAPVAGAVRVRFGRDTIIALVAIALSVTVFRGAYEQVGNTVALWADAGVDRRAGAFVIPMTWFISLNPLFVILMTPPLLAYWSRRAAKGHDQAPARRMALGALIIAAAYLMLAGAAWLSGSAAAPWAWLFAFFVAFTFGELFILPTGLGLFARLAPPGMGATTVAAWFLAIFSGSLAAGLVGTLWSDMSHAAFFAMLAGIAAVAAILLRSLDPFVRRVETARTTQAETL